MQKYSAYVLHSQLIYKFINLFPSFFLLYNCEITFFIFYRHVFLISVRIHKLIEIDYFKFNSFLHAACRAIINRALLLVDLFLCPFNYVQLVLQRSSFIFQFQINAFKLMQTSWFLIICFFKTIILFFFIIFVQNTHSKWSLVKNCNFDFEKKLMIQREERPS